MTIEVPTILYAALIALDITQGGNVIDRPFASDWECQRAAREIRDELPPAPAGAFYVIGCTPARGIAL